MAMVKIIQITILKKKSQKTHNFDGMDSRNFGSAEKSLTHKNMSTPAICNCQTIPSGSCPFHPLKIEINNTAMNTTTTLALAAKSNLSPKPTKTEIIDAMVKRAIENTKLQNEANSKKREAIVAKIQKAAMKMVKSIKFDVSVSSSYVNLYSYRVTSPEIEALIKELDNHRHIRIDEKLLKIEIRNQINATVSPQPDRLLKNPDTVKAIDAQLKAWGISK